jgi:hypothetical protein
MDEVCKLVIENREKTIMRRLQGMSDDMVGKNRNGTWGAFPGPPPSEWRYQSTDPIPPSVVDYSPVRVP